jgi:hypothetical protein
MWEYSCLRANDRSATGPAQAILDGFMDLRLRYVTGMGWLSDLDSDEDEYDFSDQTLYFVRSGDGVGTSAPPTVESGLRITRVSSFYDSLTWSMLTASPGMQADIIEGNMALISALNRRAADAHSGLWDMTRLVAPLDGSVPTSRIIGSIYELLGMAMYKTALEPGTDPAWMFLTTSAMKRLFDMSGIEHTVVFAGRVTPTDDDESFLCVTTPRATFAAGTHSADPRHRRAFQRVEAGCDALKGLQLAAAGT